MALEADTLGKVTRVIDGDTIEVDGKKQHIRIAETDAPEYVQKGGDKAKEALETRLLGKTVSLRNTKPDQYGRIVASVYHDNDNVGESMIKSGEVGSYGQKMSLWDRVKGNLDPASFRHQAKGGKLEDDALTLKKGKLESDKLSSKLEPDLLSGGEEPVKTDKGIVGSLKAGVKSAIEGIPGAAGAVAGAELGMAGGAVVGPVGMLAGAVGGAIVGGIAGEKVKDSITEMIPETTLKRAGFDKATREAERKAHPTASFTGELASSLPFFGVGAVGKAERIAGATIGGGMEAGRQIYEGEFEPARIVEAAAFQAVAAKPTAVTKAISEKLGNTARLASLEVNKDPVSKATIERDDSINKIMTLLDKKPAIDKDAKLVQAAIRNKETGVVEPMGPKHDEARKDATRETHDQGFIDENGNFLERKEALERAKQTKQIDPQQKLDFPEEGLHSGDLRIAGDDSFKLDKPIKVDERKIIEDNARIIRQSEGPEAAKAYLEKHLPHPEAVVHDIEESIGTNLKEVRANEREANNTRSRLERLVPDVKDREALPEAIEKGVALKGPHSKAASEVIKTFDYIGLRAVKYKVIDGMVENYVTRMGKQAGLSDKEIPGLIQSILKTPTGEAGLKSGSRFGETRTLASLQEATEAMASKGIVIEKDIAKILHGYMLDMNKAIEDKKLFNKMRTTKIADNYSVYEPRSKEIPHGYKIIDHGVYQGWYVHPSIKPALDHVLGAREPGTFMGAAIAMNSAIKRSNISASLFHAKSLVEAFTMARRYAGSKEASFSELLKLYREGGQGDTVDKWIREGGMMLSQKSVEDVSHTALEEIGRMGDKLLGSYSDKKILQSALGKVEQATLRKIDHFTWDFLHDGLKLITAEHLLEKAKIDHPNISEATHRKEISRFVNNSFGGLDWYDIARQSNSEFEKRIKMAAYSPEGRRALQVVLFAPDWTVSTLRSFTTALPKNLLAPDVVGGVKGMLKPKTQGDYARLYQMKFALTYLTLLNGINMMTSGHPIWENKDKTRIEFKDGTTMQAAKHAMEFVHFARDTDKFIADKLGFLPKAAIVSAGGLEYAGPDAPKLEDTSLVGRGKAIAKTMLPFNVQAYQGAPSGEELQRMLLGTLGMPVYGKTKMQQAKDNYEKRRRMMERKMKDAQDK